MLQVFIPSKELFIESTQEFKTVGGKTLHLEHSLISLSKWESKWCKPFLGKEDKTNEETIDYIKCMTINSNVPDEIYYIIPDKVFMEIKDYISAPMTATWFNEPRNAKQNREIVTAEIIYYWMIAQNIPMECQKWHINRLLTLIRVCSIKNTPPKKMSINDRRALMEERKALNDRRRSELNTKG